MSARCVTRPGGNEEVAGALRRRARQQRRLNLQKTLLVFQKPPACVIAHPSAAQIRLPTCLRPYMGRCPGGKTGWRLCTQLERCSRVGGDQIVHDMQHGSDSSARRRHTRAAATELRFTTRLMAFTTWCLRRRLAAICGRLHPHAAPISIVPSADAEPKYQQLQ